MKILILALSCFHLHASSWHDLELGLGQFYELPYQTSTSESEIFQLSPVILSKIAYNLNDSWELNPLFSWVIYQEHENSSSNQNIFIPQLNATYKYNQELHFTIGTSVVIYSTSGDATEEELPNGTGETTYFSPSERRNSYQQNLNLGFNYQFDQYTFNFDSYSYKLFNSELREVSLLFSFTKIFEIN